MNTRQAKAGDVPAIRRVAERSWETDYPDILNRENIDETVHEWYGEEEIQSELKNEDAIIAVAEEDGEVVGFAHGIWARRTGHILRVYVDPDHRGQGIGRELLATVRDSLLTRGSDRIQAMVLAENEAGNQFYQDAGFEKVDEGETTIGGETYTENVYRRLG
ncbi:MAG: N-acetyltransferase family protein [Haloglomus sp.]